jgi:hypothetical protein
MKSVLVQFWKWVVRREKLVEMPEFPEIGFEMGFREIVDINTQTAIIDKVKELSWSLNPKIWWGIKILSENPNVRPGELRDIKEGDIQLKLNRIQIKRMKERVEAATRFELVNGGFADLCLTTWLCRHKKKWSGKRDLNPRLRPWQGRTLPLSYSRSVKSHFYKLMVLLSTEKFIREATF